MKKYAPREKTFKSLVKGDRVVYVGQSINVFARISGHHIKDFESFAFIPCNQTILDRLESLYIHILRPPLNGKIDGGERMLAPLNLLDAIGQSP